MLFKESKINCNPMDSFKSARNCCFTLNNYTEEDVKTIMNWDCKYLVFGFEIAPTTGTPHLQGYVEWKRSKEFKTLKNLNKEIHWELRRGTAAEASNYCKKDKNFREKGEISKQGNRGDLHQLRDDVLSGTSVDEICLENPVLYHQYGRTLHKIEDIALRKKQRNWMTEGEWIYGESGSNKSKYAFENYNPETHYVWRRDNGWQDGYTGQETVIIDDFRGELTYGELLNLVDRYPYFLRRRNREPVPFLAKKVIITASRTPQDVYCNISANDSIAQLLRRFTVREFKKEECGQKWSEGNTRLQTGKKIEENLYDLD